MLKRFIFIISVCFLFTPNYSHANSCLDSLQSANRTCQQSYAYDVLVMYFKDVNNKEHKVHVKRVREKSTGTLVHADYDFVSNCTNNCSSLDEKANDILWSFRNAYMANRFYQKIIYQCDPTEERCCDNTRCNEILGVEQLDDNSQIEDADNNNQFTLKRGSKHKDGDSIDKAISRADGITKIIAKIMSYSANGQQVKQEMETVTAQSLQFLIMNTNSGTTQVCAVSGAFCNQINGSATTSNNMASFELHHNNGAVFNKDLRNFLEDVYEGDYGMHCSQSTSCSLDGSRCTITLSCIRK